MSSQSLPSVGYRSTWDWDPDDKDFLKHCQWYEDNLKIVDEKDEIVPLTLNEQQMALEYYKYQCTKEGKPGWALILKARKLGCSTWAEGTFFRNGLEEDNTRVYVIAHDDDSTGFIFEMTQIYYENLENKPPLSTSSAKEMRFAHNGSSFRIRTAGAGGRAGRAGTFTKVHFSELDKWPAPEELYGAVVNSIPDTPGVFVVAESTADGPLLLMQQLWDQAVEGRNDFVPFFFPWWQSPKYRRAVTWTDIRKYGPRDWLAKNRKFIDECERAHLEALAGEVDHELDPRNGPPGPNVPRGVHGGRQERQGTGGQGGRGTSGETGERGTDPGGHPPAENEAKGDDSRGRVSGRDALWTSDNPDRPEPPSRIREFREGGGSEEVSGRWLPPRFHVGGLDKGPERGDSPRRERPRTEPGGPIGLRRFDAHSVFRESLTPYESELIEREGLELEQINWLRYCLEHRCKGDETRRRREYPSYPEEAFEATGSDVLDPRVLAQWTKEAKESPPLAKGSMRADIDPITQVVRKVYIDSEDRTGKIEVYEYPDPKRRYVHAIDPSQGNQDGDWTVGFVMCVDTGDQVAEFRAKMDPDLAVDQLEYLSLWYNKALTMIEMNGGYGVPFMRHFADRQTVPLYEREQLDRFTKQFTKRPGWLTSTQTRSALFAELKFAVRSEKMKIRSLETLTEARTLWENAVGKIEARPGHHDDGIMACGIALLGRNHIIGLETAEKEKERVAKSPVAHFNRQLKKQLREENKPSIRKISTKLPVKRRGARGVPLNRDKRRSRI